MSYNEEEQKFQEIIKRYQRGNRSKLASELAKAFNLDDEGDFAQQLEERLGRKLDSRERDIIDHLSRHQFYLRGYISMNGHGPSHEQHGTGRDVQDDK